MLPIKKERYFDYNQYEDEVFSFSGKSLKYWIDMRQLWKNSHPNGYDELIDGTKEYTHDELMKICNHEIFNAYAYAELVHKTITINDHLNSTDRPWMQKIYEEFMSGKKILDFGCGDLTNAICFYDMGYKTTVVDVPADWIKFQEYRCRKYSVDIDFRYTYTNDSFLNDSDEFDVIYTHEVLEHVKEPDMVLKYLLNHLKVGGLAFITVTFSEGSFHLKDNHAKFGYDGNVRYNKTWMEVLKNFNLIPVGNDFYIKEK